MSKKHFIALASRIAQIVSIEARQAAADAVAEVACTFNPNFCRREFMRACGVSKKFNIQHNIGKAKYVVNHHDGHKTHNDGSPFFDIAIFRNKPTLAAFVAELRRTGYAEA